MELDDFKKTGEAGDMPEEKKENNEKINMDSFIDKLKARDQKDRKQVFSFMIIMVMFIIIYSGSQALQKEEIKSGYGILIFGFSLILLYLFRKLIRNKKIDYSAPTITFLQEAEKRYRFLPVADLLITIPLLALLITGGGMIVKSTFMRYFPGSNLPLIIYLVFMAGVIAFGFWASYRNWLRDKGEILQEIRELKKEFEGN